MPVEFEQFHGFLAHLNHPAGPGPLQRGICWSCNATQLRFIEVGSVRTIDGDRRRHGIAQCESCGETAEQDFLATDVRFRIRIRR